MSQQISGLPCGKILGTLADGVTPIHCILDAGHDEARSEKVRKFGWDAWLTQTVPGTPHVARVEVAP